MSGRQRRSWHIDGPRLLPCNEVHVYAYEQGCMIAMLDGELRENHVAVTMLYVSPPWRGSLVLRDMLAALKLRYRHIVVARREAAGGSSGT